MKKVIAILLAILLAISLAACEPSGYEVDIDNGTGRGQISAIEDYHTTTGWMEGRYIVTPEGHQWEVSNPDGYVGYVDVYYDGCGTPDKRDDIPIWFSEQWS